MVNRLREVRESLGYSQRDLSQMSGVTQATISHIENGVGKPRPSTLRRLADAMDVDVREITRGPQVRFKLPNMPGVMGLVREEDLKQMQRGE
jgi:transcriptional regulator with XRE-family HTH domain